MQVGIGLYVKDSQKAVALYQEAFSLTLGYHVLNADGSFYHSELYRGDEEILSVVESKTGGAPNHIVQVCVPLESEEAVRHAFAVLSAHGTVEMPVGPLPWSPCAAMVLDEFGVWWYLSAPQHRPGDDFDPTKEWMPDTVKMDL